MRPGFTRLVARQLNGLSELLVEEAANGQPLKNGCALFAPGDCSIAVERTEDYVDAPFTVTTEDVSSSIERMRKRVDSSMTSAAELFGSRTIGVLLTGIGDDGRDGMKAIREFGGRTIAQDEATSVVHDMPRTAINAGVVDEVLPLWSIADRIIEVVGEI